MGSVIYIPKKANPIVEKELQLVWDDIVNVPVADVNSVSNWNTLFNLPTRGTAFTSIAVSGNTVKLYGGSNIIYAHNSNTNIIGINDVDGCIIAIDYQGAAWCANLQSISLPALTIIDSFGFYYNSSLTYAYLPALETISDETFGFCNLSDINLPELLTMGLMNFRDNVNLSTFYIPKCVALGDTVSNNNQFYNILGRTITLTVPAALMTCNGGSPDGDIQYLQANNTVTIITV